MRQVIAALLLVVWVGAYHHDEWAEVTDIAHSHHGPSDSGDSGEHEEPLSGEDEDAPINLADIHSTAVALTTAKVLNNVVSAEVGDLMTASVLLLLVDYWPPASNCLPRFSRSILYDPAVPRLLILASSIRANAPPALS